MLETAREKWLTPFIIDNKLNIWMKKLLAICQITVLLRGHVDRGGTKGSDGQALSPYNIASREKGEETGV